jgi:hypothetical protein
MNDTRKHFAHCLIVDRRQFLAASGGGAAVGLIGSPHSARAQGKYAGQKVVFASWGGAYQDAQKQGFCEPFAKETGAIVIQDGPVILLLRKTRGRRWTQQGWLDIRSSATATTWRKIGGSPARRHLMTTSQAEMGSPCSARRIDPAGDVNLRIDDPGIVREVIHRFSGRGISLSKVSVV